MPGKDSRGRRLYQQAVPAISLIDAKRPAGADTVAVEEDHDLPHLLLVVPCTRDLLLTASTDSIDLQQLVGELLDDVEDLHVEVVH